MLIVAISSLFSVVIANSCDSVPVGTPCTCVVDSLRNVESADCINDAFNNSDSVFTGTLSGGSLLDFSGTTRPNGRNCATSADGCKTNANGDCAFTVTLHTVLFSGSSLSGADTTGVFSPSGSAVNVTCGGSGLDLVLFGRLRDFNGYVYANSITFAFVNLNSSDPVRRLVGGNGRAACCTSAPSTTNVLTTTTAAPTTMSTIALSANATATKTTTIVVPTAETTTTVAKPLNAETETPIFSPSSFPSSSIAEATMRQASSSPSAIPVINGIAGGTVAVVLLPLIFAAFF